jgi:hypothetical protein
MFMSTTRSQSQLFDELATFFASAPSQQEILDYRPLESVVRRASELLELNREGRLGESLSEELDQFEQAELLMRLVKARIRAEGKTS